MPSCQFLKRKLKIGIYVMSWGPCGNKELCLIERGASPFTLVTGLFIFRKVLMNPPYPIHCVLKEHTWISLSHNFWPRTVTNCSHTTIKIPISLNFFLKIFTNSLPIMKVDITFHVKWPWFYVEGGPHPTVWSILTQTKCHVSSTIGLGWRGKLILTVGSFISTEFYRDDRSFSTFFMREKLL